LSIVSYLPLSSELLESIVGLQLQKVVQRMQEQHGIALSWSPAAIAHIVAQCGTHETGARRISQFIEHNVLTQLAHLWLQAMQQHITIHQVVLQAESEPLTQFCERLPVEPKAGLHLQIHVDE
jgi:type VI secretion system protein VasG